MVIIKKSNFLYFSRYDRNYLIAYTKQILEVLHFRLVVFNLHTFCLFISLRFFTN